MDITIYPGKLTGTLQVIPSKSQAHRFLICAALAEKPTQILCSETNGDMDATVDCLNCLGASIQKYNWGYLVNPIQVIPDEAQLYCRDSGSTLRFLLPIAGALGVDTTFHLEGRLPQRPLSPLWEEMERMGCKLSRSAADTIRCSGKLKSGKYSISGIISSQFITGLLLALPIIGNSTLSITGTLESKPYVAMTREAMRTFGIRISEENRILGGKYQSAGTALVEGDWSNGAFFMTACALGNDISVENLSPTSSQGDRSVQELLVHLKDNI